MNAFPTNIPTNIPANNNLLYSSQRLKRAKSNNKGNRLANESGSLFIIESEYYQESILRNRSI